MIITKIEKKNNRSFRIWLNDAPAFCLAAADLKEYDLMEGMELSKSLCDILYGEILPKAATLRCMQILKSYDRTELQLRTKLREDEYPDSAIDAAIAYVKSYHYVDDASYACRYVQSRQESKSPLQLRAELLAKGVSDADITYALETEYTQEQDEAIRYWMRKRGFDPEHADEKEKQKFMQFLLRKGFPYGEIKKTLT